MAKADGLKEEIGYLKLVFGLLVAIEVSLIAWLAQNFRTADTVVTLCAIVATLLDASVTIGITAVIYRRIAELREV